MVKTNHCLDPSCYFTPIFQYKRQNLQKVPSTLRPIKTFPVYKKNLVFAENESSDHRLHGMNTRFLAIFLSIFDPLAAQGVVVIYWS